MKRKLAIFVFVFSLITILFFNPMVITHATDKKVIRVGYPLVGNVSQKAEDGSYYGYDYEYLKQIAQYTGWEYEFVEVEGDLNQRLVTLLDMLEKGEIDLLGSMNYNDALANVYDYASEPYGYSYQVLIAKTESHIYDQNSLLAMDNIRIAINEKATSTAKKLSQFAQMNSFTYEEVRTKDDGIYEILDKGIADVALSNDMTVPEGYRIISKFFPDPFYFVTTKGNAELVSQLNNALISINEANPTFQSTLYNRYFAADNNKFILNEKEKEYMKKNSVIQVLTRSNQAPVQYVEAGKIKGVAKDILDIVEQETGARFEYTIANDYEDFKTLSQSGKYDILIGLPYEMKVAETFDITLTNPYISGNLVLIANTSIDPNHLEQYTEGKTPYTFKDYNMNKRINSKIFETPEEILLAIENGDIQYTYLNSFIATYYINKNNLKDVSTFTVPDYLKSQYSYGVKKSDDLILLGILNKMIGSISDDLNSLIYKNANIEKNFSFMTMVQENLAISLGSLFALVAVVIIIIHRYYTHQLKMKKAVELEYKRYQMLYDMTGEMTFAYNYLKDELKISQSGLKKLANEGIIEHFSKIEFDDKESDQVENVISQYLMKQQDVSCEIELTLVNGEKNWYQLTMKLVTDVDKSSKHAVYAIGKVLDIQKDKEEKEVLKQNSMTDILTGIYNRAGAQEKMTERLQNSDALGALIMLDLDNFKDINDIYGHLDGDIVLQQIAEVLTRVYKGAIVARLGGDEFVIYMEHISQDEMSRLCQTALKEITEIPYSKGKNIKMSMSMGVVFNDYSRQLEDLMSCADKKLYEVKRHGKNGFEIYGYEKK